MSNIPQKKVDNLYDRLRNEAETIGYHLNPDTEFAKELVEGLLINDERFGYPSCPCRLASGDINKDLDIVCPCDYRDADILDFGACYCSLYVSEDVVDGKKEVSSIPERRTSKEKIEEAVAEPKIKSKKAEATSLAYPVWRCKVCGYLCARDDPPEICPVCKAKQNRFERFM